MDDFGLPPWETYGNLLILSNTAIWIYMDSETGEAATDADAGKAPKA